MPKAYFIGGEPRVGKTTLSLSVLRKHPMQCASSDAIRHILRGANTAESYPELFALSVSRQPENEIIHRLTDDYNLAIKYQNDESRVVWKSIEKFVESNLKDGHDVLIEGIAVLPELVSKVEYEYEAVFLGNGDESHIKEVMKVAENNPYDWLKTLNPNVAFAFCKFNHEFGKYVKDECLKYNQTYIKVDDSNFDQSIRYATHTLLDKHCR